MQGVIHCRCTVLYGVRAGRRRTVAKVIGHRSSAIPAWTVTAFKFVEYVPLIMFNHRELSRLLMYEGEIRHCYNYSYILQVRLPKKVPHRRASRKVETIRK
jgi:hypothetical protein